MTEKGRTQVAQWQKLPSGILREYCEKQRRPPPKFKELLNGKTSFKCRVICPDPKKKPDKDLIIIPAKPVQNEEQAKEEAALLALLHLTPKLPHERKLPEPYKTTWLAAVAQQKADAIAARTKEQNDNNRNNSSSNKVQKDLISSTVSNSSNLARKAGASSNTHLTLGTAFTSHSEKRKLTDQKRQVRNARIRKHEAVRMANRDHPVFLSARLRNSIQKILRGDFAGLLTNNNDDENDEDNPELNEFGSDLQCCVEERLHGEGFTKRQARTVFDQKGKGKETIDEEYWEQVYDDCLQWLCVHLDEDQLPEGFDPRGSTLEVVAAPNSTSTGAVGNNTGEALRIAEKFGISIRDASWLLQQKQEKDSTTEKSLEVIFWNQICKIANVDVSEEICESHGDENENKEMVQDEFEAIEAMFQSDCALKTDVDGKSSTIDIKTPEMMDIRFTFSQIYPSVFPTRILFLEKWERPVGVAFHVKIAQYLSTLTLGDPMLFEIYGEAQSIIQSLEDLPFLPLSAASVPATIDKESSGTHSSSSSFKKETSKETTKAKSIKRRPRTRSAFWSTPPEKTTPATPFCWSKSMERQRKSLPAWKARDDFLAKLDESCKSGNRVVLVTGDTGCGKTTQIPQFILEENPTSAKIVIAQPRRLAVSFAVIMGTSCRDISTLILEYSTHSRLMIFLPFFFALYDRPLELLDE